MIPLAALGKLNTHARSPAGHHQRDAIYAYKTLAATMLAVTKDAKLRFVKWTGKCSMCTNGRFTHWSWDDGYTVACRDCGGTSIRTLRFTETKLPDGQVWHHPWNGRTMPGHTIAQAVGISMNDRGEYQHPDGSPVEWSDPGEWRPLLPAKPLPLDELVEALNEVEDWIDSATERPGLWYTWESARRYLRSRRHAGIIGAPSHAYSLDLGRAPGGCFVCGTESDLDSIAFGRIMPLFHWSLPVCKAHRNSPHPKDPPPDAMLTPAIRRWMNRHETVDVVD